MSDRIKCERCKGMRDTSVMVGKKCMSCVDDERMEAKLRKWEERGKKDECSA